MSKAKKQPKQETSFSFWTLSFALVCALALAGCGGGGGGSTAVMPTPGGGQQMPGGGSDMTGGGMTGGSAYTPPPRTRMLDAEIPDALVDTVIDELAGDVRRAARNTPAFGTRDGIGYTTKTSHNNHPDIQTLNPHFLDAEYDANGQLQFSRTNVSASFMASTTDSGLSFNRLNGSPAQGWQSVETQADYPPAVFYWDASTDRTGAGDLDYLVLGYWAIYLKDTNTGELTGSTSIGVSAGGSDPFTANNIAGLTGTATYEGPATGILADRTESGEDPFHYVTAKAILEADFGDGSALGTIFGRIAEARVEGGDALPDMNLGAADITNSWSGGNFRGDTSVTTSSGETLSGSWGGKFFGNGAGATDQPGSMAGTFGATSADGNVSVVGAFGAYKQ